MNITQSRFQNNTATNGGAIYIPETKNLTNYNLNVSMTIDKTNFTNNEANSNGGAINNNATLDITNSYFKDNNATNGGAIYNTNYLNINNSSFINNTANSGGAITNHEQTAVLNIISAIFTNNTAKNGGGGAINHGMSAILNIDNTNFTDNNSTNYGNTISSHYSNSTTITSSIFKSNNGRIIFNSVGILNITYSTFAECYNNGKYIISTENGPNNLNFNWWGSNDNPSSKISGAILNNYYTVFFTNINKPSNIENAIFKVSFVLNGTNDTSGFEKLPNINVKAYNNEKYIGEYTSKELINIKPIIGVNNILLKLDEESYNKSFNISKINTKISTSTIKGSYGQTITLTTKLTSDGKALANKKVNFYVNGKFIGSATTNKEGIAKLKYKIPKVAKYTVKTSFIGDSQYNKIESTKSFKATKAKVSMGLKK
ncbi:Ig-like domain-containing protein [Methanobrevibacter arboriphilus]|uniref:Ig-like domain-containing protein n=1 Tax=Methanobrevibacter arboriphilus TaxID=39441 RepID=UPI000AB0F39E|nr:Ig-like domain-containing protein [Methanobrevibacter arboriphilus]